jgi:exodeoxyribonuclease-1
MPLCKHPTNNNGVIVYDLRVDPTQWINLSVEEIKTRIYTRSDQLPEGVERIPLTTIHINKCPMVTSVAVLSAENAEKFTVDMAVCKTNWEILNGDSIALQKVADVFRDDFTDAETDPDFMIYSGGFFGDNDKSLMKTIRATKPSDLGRLDMPFRDKRLKELFFRFRARNYPATLSQEEEQRWEEFRLSRVLNEQARQVFQAAMAQAKDRIGDDDKPSHAVLDDLQRWVDQISLSTLSETQV